MTSNSSRTDPGASLPPARVRIGRVLRAHGVRGEVLAEIWTHAPEVLLAPGSRVSMCRGDAGASRLVEVVGSRSAPGGPARRLIRLDGIGDREAAQALRGVEFEVDAALVPPPPTGTFFARQLVGCQVRDESCGELGRVVEVRDEGAGPLLVVRGDRYGEVLVPFVESFLSRFDEGKGLLEMNLPEGLVETCASRS